MKSPTKDNYKLMKLCKKRHFSLNGSLIVWRGYLTVDNGMVIV